MNPKTYSRYLFILCVVFGTIIFLIIMSAIPTHALDCPPTCPNASEWSSCTGGHKTHIEYTCSNDTDYFCEAKSVEISCGGEYFDGSIQIRPIWRNIIIYASIFSAIAIYLFFHFRHKRRFWHREVKEAVE